MRNSLACATSPACRRLTWPERQARLNGLASRIDVLTVDRAAAVWLGRERARLAQAGRPAPRTDGEIAAVAVVQGLILVTRNARDFAAFSDLVTVDWHVQAPRL